MTFFVYVATHGPACARCLRRDPMPASPLPWRLLGAFRDDEEARAWEVLHEAPELERRAGG